MHTKSLTFRNALIAMASVGLGMSTFAACGVNYNWDGIVDAYAECTTDPTVSFYHSPECKIRRCTSDAGLPEDNCPDAGSSSSSSSGSSARCSGTCVSNAPNDFAPPQIVYVGKPLAKYAYSCPSEAGAFGGREYFDLDVPDPGCPKCLCGPIEGSCDPRPNYIRLHAGICGIAQPVVTDFSAPENWDGSCTKEHAVPAGLECPPGSGILCAQSINSSALPDPVQGCESIPMPVPKLTDDLPSWSTMVLSCSTTPRSESCNEPESNTCLPRLPTEESGWRYCVRHDDPGVHPCPSSLDSDFSQQFIAYGDYIDTRKCTECGCKTSGGFCYGTLRVYSDDTCSTNQILTAEGVTSDNILCSNFAEAGVAIGSKEMTGLTYVPGKCEPTGGFTIGSAYPDEATEATWCCMPAPNVADAGADAPTQ